MKRILQHPPRQSSGKRYWRSPAELDDTPEFRDALEREFPAGAAEMEMDGVSRRSFLKLMGASTALAGMGLAACRRPEHKLLPFTESKEWTIPGKVLFYATAMPRRDGALPLVVSTIDGRPIKVDGNPRHAATAGVSDKFAQASILGLYDPDRTRFFVQAGTQSDEQAFSNYLDGLLERSASEGGAGMAFVVEENNSPTRERLRGEILKRFPQAQWCVYEPTSLAGSGAVSQAAFGNGVRTSLNIAEADVILSLDSDFLGTDDGSVWNARQFSKRRKPNQEDGRTMNRLYAVENRYTVTGGMADHRLRLPASHIGAFALELAKQIGGVPVAEFSGMLPAAPGAGFPAGWVEELAKDLVRSRGRSLVVAGPRQPMAVQLLAQAMNQALGNLGKTVIGSQDLQKPGVPIMELARSIAEKKVSSLFILGGNPVYNAPADLQWGELQKLVPDVVRLGMHHDETSTLSRWQVPAAHYLESWGDGFAADGTYVSVQPMILPLYDGWSENDLLAVIAGRGKPGGPENVQETFRELQGGGNFDETWSAFLRDGFAADSAPAPRALFMQGIGGAAAAAAKPLIPASADHIEVVLIPDATIDDGRYANVSWLQETPDPVTKLTWDNAALLSPKLAKHLGVVAPAGVLGGPTEGDILRIEVDGRSIEVAALISPGHADNSITVALGYGRKMIGGVADGAGVNAYPLLVSDSPYILTGAKVEKTGGSLRLALTQDHWNMEGRAYIREGTLETYEERPDFAQKFFLDAHEPAAGFKSLYSNPPLDALQQWGMTVDLNTCTGCNACVVACQAENNIPVVGKDQVLNGREMHWIRLDRYYASVEGREDDPEMITQPVMCQHCENAPCETVCPVNATVHSNDGLNVMAYNRCIGTRYCANNCPFKVRRFNFFDYNQRPIAQTKMGPFKAQGLYFGPLTEKGAAEVTKMQKNPNVTVRMRGVMEKCTFCVQRIAEAKITAKVRAGASDDVSIPVDSFQVACQQACPSEAIVFGDISNPESKVSKVKADARNYRLLAYLHVKERVSYLAKIRNLNMAMPGAGELAAYEAPEHGAPDSHEPDQSVDSHQPKEAH